MAKPIIPGNEWIRLVLEKLNIDPSKARRVIIDACVEAPLMLYVEMYGTAAVLDVRPPEANEVKIVIVGDSKHTEAEA